MKFQIVAEGRYTEASYYTAADINEELDCDFISNPPMAGAYTEEYKTLKLKSQPSMTVLGWFIDIDDVFSLIQRITGLYDDTIKIEVPAKRVWYLAPGLPVITIYTDDSDDE